MGTDPLPARLERGDANATVTAFPDGSVDTFYGVYASGDRVETRAAFADRVVADSVDAFSLHRRAVEPGGHAVNLAAQAAHLGSGVTAAGHLDDRAFADLPFEAVSMGEPASVSVYGFDDGDVLAVDESAALASWTLADLEAALGDGGGDGPEDDLEAFLTADVVCCANWTSIASLPDALASIADLGLDGGLFLFDPGAPAGRPEEDVARLFDALESLTAGYDVVLAANPHEIDVLSRRSGGAFAEGEAADPDAALGELRERAGLSGVVVHGASHAAAATEDGFVTDDNFEVDVARHTGGGDRFDAGLAHALARGWEWADALRLGNACASWYVATGDSGTSGELATFLRARD